MSFERGSEWRKWDLHVHTPYSYLNNQFGSNFDEYVKQLFLNAILSQIAVIGITDYFSIDGYKKIKQEYLDNDIKLKSLFTDEQITQIKTIKIIPNIEFRLNKIIGTNRVNFHVIFSDEISIEDIEENFLHELEFVYEGNPQDIDEKWKLKISNIENLGKKLISEQPELGDNSLFVGLKCAVVDDTQILDILKNKQSKFKNKYLIVVPADEDLSTINWKSQDHNVRKVILQKADMLFASNPKTIQWGLGKFNETEEDYIKEFKSIKVCIWGSDAHGYDNLFKPANNRFTWIKANSTFEGLKQVINEPMERSYIGESPEKRQLVALNKTKYIDKIKINKTSIASVADIWFNNEIELNENLVTIIGNKGNGKSALADIISLCGNTRLIDSSQFSFLNKDKFKKNGLAKNFEATLIWKDGTSITKNLSDDISSVDVEKVKYLPQKYIETICTHDYEKFQDEINKVVFSHISESNKLQQDSLKNLIKEKTEFLQKKRNQIKGNLKELFANEIFYKREYSEDELKRIHSRILEKDNEIKDHEKYRLENILVVPKPDEDESVQYEQRAKFKKIERLNKHQSILEKYINKLQENINRLATKKNIIINTQHKIQLHIEDFEYFKKKLSEDFNNSDIGLNIDELLSLIYNQELLKTLEVNINSLLNKYSLLIEQVKNIYKAKNILIESLHGELDDVQKKYQSYITQLSTWTQRQQELLLEKEKLQSKIQFKEKELPTVLKNIKREIFLEFQKLYESYQDELKIYEELYKPVLEFVENEKKKRISTLKGFIEFTTDIILKKSDFKNKILDFFDNRRKKFNDDEVVDIIANNSINSMREIYRLNRKIIHTISNNKKIEEQFRDSKELIDFYLTLWDLDNLSVEYDILLDSKKVFQLSPGERGALLIIFYLLVDKDDIPLIIDQPEDNLDNESVFEYLVPYIKQAKQRRQIIIVTHNPNIAVVADSEQVIYSKIDKADKNRISYTSGAIEDSIINEKIIEVLEGTFPAFDNRTKKYYRI